MSCPEIDVLLDRAGARSAAPHLESCAACAAVASLAELREERLAAEDQGCVRAEVALALWRTGELEPGEERELVAHLERCASCNDVAVRVRSLAEPEPRVEARPRAALGRQVGLGLSLAVAASVVFFLLGRASRPPVPVALPEPVGPTVVVPAPAPEPQPAGVPCVAPSGEPERPLAPPAPKVAPKRGSAKDELIDPWREPGADAAATASVGFLSLVCLPACTVHIDGRAMGPAPIVRAPLSPGVHQIRLANGPTVRQRRIAITAGKTSAIRIDMTEKPPAPKPEEPAIMNPWE